MKILLIALFFCSLPVLSSDVYSGQIELYGSRHSILFSTEFDAATLKSEFGIHIRPFEPIIRVVARFEKIPKWYDLFSSTEWRALPSYLPVSLLKGKKNGSTIDLSYFGDRITLKCVSHRAESFESTFESEWNSFMKEPSYEIDEKGKLIKHGLIKCEPEGPCTNLYREPSNFRGEDL